MAAEPDKKPNKKHEDFVVSDQALADVVCGLLLSMSVRCETLAAACRWQHNLSAVCCVVPYVLSGRGVKWQPAQPTLFR